MLTQNTTSKAYYGDLAGGSMWSTAQPGRSVISAHARGQLEGPIAQLFAIEEDKRQLPALLEVSGCRGSYTLACSHKASA